MNLRLRALVIPALLVVVAAAVYVPRLQDTPPYPAGDELFAALTAHSVASTGRDMNGRFLPLYFQMPPPFRREVWFQPILMYGIAVTLTVLPLSEGTIRLPMALFGVLDVLLIYLVGKRLFQRESLAIGAAVLLGLTPAHFSTSRVALEFQAPLPFMLGWLLCLLTYLERGRRSWLFAAGLMLGIGLYTYIAAYMLMPIYALLTCGVLYKRQEPLNRYAALAAGFILPALLCLLFLLQHHTVVSDMFLHYQHDETQDASALPPSTGFATFRRVANIGLVYGSFWTPRLLFIYGRQSMWLRGLFLLPVAGLLVAALLRLVRRPAPDILLLIGGLVSAPLPASLVAQSEAIHRAAAMLPFGALLAIMGLEYVWTAETPRARRVAFVAAWATVIGLAVIYHDDLPGAQAMLRVATVPLAVTGLAVLMRHVAIDWGRFGRMGVVALAVLIAVEIAYVVVDYWTMIRASVVLLTAIGLATLMPGSFDRLSRRPHLVVALLAVMSSVFLHVYVENPNIPRVPFIPASVMFLAGRFVVVAAALAAVLMVVRHVRVDRLSRGRAAVAIVLLVCIQLAYFYIDYFAGFPVRFIQATAVLAGVVGLALLQRGPVVGRLRLGQIAAATLFALASTQIASFYVNYFPGYRVHMNAGLHEARVAFETAIERARTRVVPAVYLGGLGPHGDVYWRFYAIKHNRLDLLARTIADSEFKPDRVRDLPAGSIAIVGRSTETDKAIDGMVISGQLTADPLNAPDGTPMFWILERGEPTR